MHIHTYSRTYICTYIRVFTRPSVSTCPAHMYAYAWINQNALHNFNNHAQSYGQQAKLKEENKNLTINLFIYLFIKLLTRLVYRNYLGHYILPPLGKESSSTRPCFLTN